jgi:hypothetical protein
MEENSLFWILFFVLVFGFRHCLSPPPDALKTILKEIITREPEDCFGYAAKRLRDISSERDAPPVGGSGGPTRKLLSGKPNGNPNGKPSGKPSGKPNGKPSGKPSGGAAGRGAGSPSRRGTSRRGNLPHH